MRPVPLSKTQIDRLGDRLRTGSLTQADIRILDEYRRSFQGAYDAVVQTIAARLRLEPTGRPAKSTTSLVEKLHRESIRLTQVQDIAGCRVVVADVVKQDRVVKKLRALFPAASVVDRRASPSHGYRAVHLIVGVSGKLVEVQIRSAAQHSWAELSEKLADVSDPAIKYGGGSDTLRQLLDLGSEAVRTFEEAERVLARAKKSIAKRLPAERRRLRKAILLPARVKLRQTMKKVDSLYKRAVTAVEEGKGI